MGDEFYCILKLVSGEEILSLIMIDENNGDPIIILQNPVIMRPSMSSTGHYYVKINPWMEMANDDIFFIKFDKVITMTETKESRLIQLYEYYINNSNLLKNSNTINVSYREVNPSSVKGYVTSVKEARKNLENLFKDCKEL